MPSIRNASGKGNALPVAVDCAALRLMLTYVENECRRLGAHEAAFHAAAAASMMPGQDIDPLRHAGLSH